MLAHTRTHLTKKDAIKARIKEDLCTFKQYYRDDVDDVLFMQDLQSEIEDLLHPTDDRGLIPADEAFRDLIDKHTKAGALLRGTRVLEGLTQTEFAKLIGTTQANVSAMENGKRPIGKNKAKLIAEKFNTDYRYFL
jgi:DNA-binding XRE family transcriptional regulator